jgi:pimeloyl-ACP methyl ester carboxylesterase
MYHDQSGFRRLQAVRHFDDPAGVVREAPRSHSQIGAGIVTELAITRPDLVASLFLVAPVGALRTEPSEELEAFWEAEEAALEAGDLDAAVEANLRTWVDGPYRLPQQVDPSVRSFVGEMQRRAFEVTEVWGEVDEEWLDPRAGTRLGEVGQPTLVLVGDGDLPVVRQTAERVAADVPGARLVRWPVVAHLLSMERPADCTRLLLEWIEDPSSAGA